MNFAQFGLFTIYVLSVIIEGILIYSFINKDDKVALNRYIYLGELFLLGSIFLIAELLGLSLIRLYKAPFLWGVVMLNYAFLLNRNIRDKLYALITKNISFDFPTIAFAILIVIFIFRNCYFLIDIDSLSTYLFAQKLWLSAGTSLIGGVTNDIRIFVPHFNAVPYSLGISIFGQQTLFPQLVDLSWRVVVLALVFGYASYRFNRYYGLAASMLIIFNEHFFYSGANQWVILNGAVIALLFAAVYNFWESRIEDSLFRFFLALFFLTQIMANKYQLIYVAIFVLLVGILIQPSPVRRILNLVFNRKLITILLLGLFFASLWYLKNLLVTGDPVFPIFAGKLRIFNWVPWQEHAFLKIFSVLKPMKFLKFMNFFFIWPGINAAKYVIIMISFLPLLLMIYARMDKAVNRDILLELSFWLGISILVITGTCLTTWQDPRVYRYSIGILSFTAVLSTHFILSECLKIRNKIILYGIILTLPLLGGANEGYKIIYKIDSSFKMPTLKENIGVITNKIHMDYIINKHHPEIPTIINSLNNNTEKLSQAAWDMNSFKDAFPAFLLPVRPAVSFFYNAVISWDSYTNKDMIARDLRKNGIEWIMKLEDNKIVFISVNDYAQDALRYERNPKKIYYDYSFPAELVDISP